MTPDNREFIYLIDAQNRILSANENWFAFALENGVSTLTAPQITGRELWDFISDRMTRYLYQTMLEKVRATGASVTVPYRCDSPNQRRFMQLTIHRRPKAEIEFRSRILGLESREPVRLLEAKIIRSSELLVMCGWCKKVLLPGGELVEVEDAVKTLHLFDAPCLPQITHSICKNCGVMFEDQIRSLGSSRN